MIVVEMQDDRVQGKALVAAHRAAPADVLEAVEQPVEARANRVRLVRIARQRVSALVRGAERARSAGFIEVLAERLRGPAPGALRNRACKLDLIFARHLMHTHSPLCAFYACGARGAPVRNWTLSADP